jgi:hypothetical protein
MVFPLPTQIRGHGAMVHGTAFHPSTPLRHALATTRVMTHFANVSSCLVGMTGVDSSTTHGNGMAPTGLKHPQQIPHPPLPWGPASTTQRLIGPSYSAAGHPPALQLRPGLTTALRGSNCSPARTRPRDLMSEVRSTHSGALGSYMVDGQEAGCPLIRTNGQEATGLLFLASLLRELAPMSRCRSTQFAAGS